MIPFTSMAITNNSISRFLCRQNRVQNCEWRKKCDSQKCVARLIFMANWFYDIARNIDIESSVFVRWEEDEEECVCVRCVELKMDFIGFA